MTRCNYINRICSSVLVFTRLQDLLRTGWLVKLKNLKEKRLENHRVHTVCVVSPHGDAVKPRDSAVTPALPGLRGSPLFTWGLLTDAKQPSLVCLNSTVSVLLRTHRKEVYLSRDTGHTLTVKASFINQAPQLVAADVLPFLLNAARQFLGLLDCF